MIDPGLHGRVALVTGANHGIGAATARALAAQGVAVFLTYLRLDLARPAAQSLREGLRCTVHFTTPVDRRLILLAEGQRTAAFLVQRTPDGALEDFLETSAQVAAGDILEASIPFADLGLSPRDPFAFFVSIQSGATELERHPQFRPVEGRMPEKTFEQELWKA